jgi:nucleotide-binding universal stress UspA family protein
VRAVRVRPEPRVDLGWLRPDRIAEWDCAEQRVRHELELALSAETIIHPEVAVETMIVQDRPASFLVAISHSAQLLVLGRTARGAQVAEIAGSPIDALLRSSACPVMIVPSDGPPRSTLLQTRERAKALAGTDPPREDRRGTP